MLNNEKFLKVGAYAGLLSIVSSNVAMAISPKSGQLYIHSHKELRMVGAPPLHPVVEDISRVSYEDFDVTANCPPLMRQFGNGDVFGNGEKKVRKWHLDTNIPYIGGSNPKVDYMALRGIPQFMAQHLDGKLHPMDRAGAQELFEKVIVKNHQNLRSDMQEIPNMDCLYYKNVGGSQHLFLRLSSETRKRAEVFNKESNGKTIYAEQGNVRLISDGNATLDHVKIKANNIEVDVKDTLLNRASKMKAKWVIRLKAGKQRNETVINKWVREDRGKHHFTHEEGVESVDDCVFVAEEVIQEGDEVENIGIYVEADEFEDRATHTSNMPAKITLYNYAWEEDDGMFSHAETSVKRKDDVLVPTRYHVNYYKSDSSKPGSSVKYGYTLIDAGSKIEILKDIKEDVAVEEEHTLEIHEEKDGFSFCGGASIPDPTKLLRKIDKASSSGNMIGLTTSIISAVAKGIRAVDDYKTVRKLMNQKAPLGRAGASELLKVLSHFVNGPSIQFGSRSFDMRQKQTKTHGTTMVSPYMKFHNKKYSSFRGTYKGKEIDIKTGTFVTFDLPQTMESEMEMHQSGISMDLLTFAAMLIAPGTAGVMQAVMEAAVASSSISVSFEENKSRIVQHNPTIIQADKINIEADNGYLTQAQIKAGIVHAVFTNDLVLKTLANEKWQTREGGGMSFGLGALVGFETLAETLVEAAASTSISSIDSGSFERIIDDFASMVGEEEFYLKVGNVLRTESAFVGHKTHDPAHEHIEAKERQDVKVEESSDSWDNSVDFVVDDWRTVVNTFKKQILDKAFEEGASIKEAVETSDHAVEVLEGIRKIQKEVKSKEEAKKTSPKQKKETPSEGREENPNADAINDTLKRLSQPQPGETPLQEAVRINMLAELMNCSRNPTAENQSKLESTWEVSKKYLGKTLDVIFAPIAPQTAEAVPAVVAPFVAPAAATKACAAVATAQTVWISICRYLSSNPQILQRAQEAVKSLPSLWMQLKKLKKDLEIKAQERAEASKERATTDEFFNDALGWERKIEEEIGILFRQGNNGSKGASGKKSSTSTPSRSNMNSGGGSAMPPDPEKEPGKDKGGTDFSDVTKSDNGRPQVTIEVKEAELKGFGVRRKIERMTADSKIGQNVVSEPHRDPKVTSDFRRGAERYLKSEGKSPKALKKVDVDHMQELQSGGSDTRANLHFLDRSFNRSIGKKINHATKDMPKGTKYEIKFKVKETGENL